MRKVTAYILLVLLLVFLGAVGLEYKTGTLPGEITRLESRGQNIVEQINHYHSVQGLFPPSLAQAGIKNRKTRFGSWEYTATTNGFSLSIGNYGNHGFVLGYNSGHGWWKDT